MLKLSSLLLTSGSSDPNHYLHASNIKFRFIKPGAQSNCSEQNSHLFVLLQMQSMFENLHTNILISSVILYQHIDNFCYFFSLSKILFLWNIFSDLNPCFPFPVSYMFYPCKNNELVAIFVNVLLN